MLHELIANLQATFKGLYKRDEALSILLQFFYYIDKSLRSYTILSRTKLALLIVLI